MSDLAPLLEAFFTERLIGQREASRHTIAAYRDAFCLLLRFAQQRTGRAPHQLALEDLDAALIGAFLNHLETERGATVRTRNARLTAIRSLFRFAAYRHPEHAAVIQRVLAIPPKRTDKVLVTYLTEQEAAALLAAPDRSTRIGRRDHALLLLALETGLRVSELTGLTCQAVQLGTGAHVRCTGKGRKERITPLRREARAVLRAWLDERGGTAGDPLFPGPNGGQLSRDAVRRLVERHIAVATAACPSLGTKDVTPHTLRHTCAMNLLRHGVDAATIALWLGHEDVRTTYSVYLHADLALKEAAISTPTWRSRRPRSPRPRHRAPAQAGTGPPTRCSPSWKACEYAALTNTLPAAAQPLADLAPHIRARRIRSPGGLRVPGAVAGPGDGPAPPGAGVFDGAAVLAAPVRPPHGEHRAGR